MKHACGVSILAQATLALYLQLVEWVNLFPWNDIRHGNGQESLDIALAAVMTGAVFGTWKQWRPAIWSAALLYAVWLALQIETFWAAYAMGASARWQRIYDANFGHTVQWLPRWDHHLPPDANHFVLQLLVAAALLSTAAAAWSLRGGAGRSAPPPLVP